MKSCGFKVDMSKPLQLAPFTISTSKSQTSGVCKITQKVHIDLKETDFNRSDQTSYACFMLVYKQLWADWVSSFKDKVSKGF